MVEPTTQLNLELKMRFYKLVIVVGLPNLFTESQIAPKGNEGRASWVVAVRDTVGPKKGKPYPLPAELFDHFDEVMGVDGFDQVFVAAGLEAFVSVFFHGVSGESHDGFFEALFAQGFCRFIAVEHWHLYVHQHYVIVGAESHGDSLLTIVCKFDGCTFSGQKLLHQGLVVR